MAKRIDSEIELLDRAIKMLPKWIPEWAINDVEVDFCDGSYWVYLSDGWTCEMQCHTIHEDTLKDLRNQIRSIKLCPDDTCLYTHKGYTQGESDYYEKYWKFVEEVGI